MRRLVETTQLLDAYRDNTVFVIVPDCGRDANRGAAVPFQHHFNTKAAHEIFALAFGPGIDSGRVVDRPVDQTNVTRTVAGIMGFDAAMAESDALEEIFA